MAVSARFHAAHTNPTCTNCLLFFFCSIANLYVRRVWSLVCVSQCLSFPATAKKENPQRWLIRQIRNVHKGATRVRKMVGLTVQLSLNEGLILILMLFFIYIFYFFSKISSHTYRHTRMHTISLLFLQPVFRKEVSLLLLHCYSYRTLPGTLAQ